MRKDSKARRRPLPESTTRNKPLTWNENKEWQDVLLMIKKLLKDYLENGKYGKVLKERQGLAVGFVDGDLTLL